MSDYARYDGCKIKKPQLGIGNARDTEVKRLRSLIPVFIELRA